MTQEAIATDTSVCMARSATGNSCPTTFAVCLTEGACETPGCPTDPLYRAMVDDGIIAFPSREERDSLAISQPRGAAVSRPHLGMLVTSALLRKHGACMGARRRLRKQYPNGVRVTQKQCEKYAHTWHWEWAGQRLLNEAGKAQFNDGRKRIFAAMTQQGNAFLGLEFKAGISNRAYNMAIASLFGGLAEQKRFDPAYTL